VATSDDAWADNRPGMKNDVHPGAPAQIGRGRRGSPSSPARLTSGPARALERQRCVGLTCRRRSPGRGVELVDARLYDDVLWLLRRYHLRVTAAREPGHHTHGDGTAVDLIPADGTTQADWDASARALGWSPECGACGSRPTCSLAPAIQFIGYDGYPGHGSPRTCGTAHIHISWASPCYGAASPIPPCASVLTFRVASTPDAG
jgi:hypothetical protein